MYSPNQDRIYFVPFNQAPQATRHYVDYATGAIVGYQHGLAMRAVYTACAGGVYSPNQNRIYFVPGYQAPSPPGTTSTARRATSSSTSTG